MKFMNPAVAAALVVVAGAAAQPAHAAFNYASCMRGAAVAYAANMRACARLSGAARLACEEAALSKRKSDEFDCGILQFEDTVRRFFGIP